MKRIQILLMFSLIALLAKAQGDTDISSMDNVVYMNPVTVAAGSQQTLSICMKNTVGIQTVQFDMILPEGIRVALDDDGFEMFSLSTARTTARKMDSFSGVTISDGHYRVLINSTKGNTFDGTDGEIVQVVVNVASTVQQGDYPITFKEIVLVDTGSNGFETEFVQTTLTVSGVDDGRIHFNESSTTLPSYTPGTTGNVTIARSIKTGQWSTLVLPFNLTRSKATAIFGSDVEFAKFDGFEVDYGDDEENVTPLGILVKFTSYTIPVRGNMAGGTPVLIRIHTAKDITKIEADDVTLTNTVTDVTKDADGDIGEYVSGKFTASLVKTVVPEDGLFISDEHFWYSVGLTNIKGFRGWFELDAVLDKETDFGANIRFVVNDDATGIQDIELEGISEGWYSLDGRKLNGKPAQKGIYIQNGKKVRL